MLCNQLHAAATGLVVAARGNSKDSEKGQYREAASENKILSKQNIDAENEKEMFACKVA